MLDLKEFKKYNLLDVAMSKDLEARMLSEFLQAVECDLRKLAAEQPVSYSTYYVGGSLCLDYPTGTLTFLLDGTMSDFKSGVSTQLNDECIAYIRQIYVSTKGETQYYIDELAKCS